MLDVFITSRVRRKIVVVYAKYPDFRTHVRGLAKLIKEDPGNIQLLAVVIGLDLAIFVDINQRITVWYTPEINEWQGRRTVEARLLHLEVI